MTGDQGYALLGFLVGHRWRPPEAVWARGLPAEVVTASECLADFLPSGWDTRLGLWHGTLTEAIEAARQAVTGPEAVRVLTVGAPRKALPELATLFGDRVAPGHPVQDKLARPVSLPSIRPHGVDAFGQARGYEVLGFELPGFVAGRLHSWLCYDLRDGAPESAWPGIGANGLLSEAGDAERIAEAANQRRGTGDGTPEEVTWIPALITEYAAVI